MGNPSSSATDLAGMIAGMIADATGKQKDRQFRRGVVDSFSGGFANVLIEGSPSVTQHIPLACRVVAGDRVLVLSIGDSGTNLLVLSNLSPTFPIGEHVVGYYTGGTAVGSGYTSLAGFTLQRDTWGFYNTPDGKIYNRSGTTALIRLQVVVRFVDGGGGGDRGLAVGGSGVYQFTGPDGGGRYSLVFNDVVPFPNNGIIDIFTWSSTPTNLAALSFDFERVG